MCKKNERREPNAGNSDAFMANRKKDGHSSQTVGILARLCWQSVGDGNPIFKKMNDTSNCKYCKPLPSEVYKYVVNHIFYLGLFKR